MRTMGTFIWRLYQMHGHNPSGSAALYGTEQQRGKQHVDAGDLGRRPSRLCADTRRDLRSACDGAVDLLDACGAPQSYIICTAPTQHLRVRIRTLLKHRQEILLVRIQRFTRRIHQRALPQTWPRLHENCWSALGRHAQRADLHIDDRRFGLVDAGFVARVINASPSVFVHFVPHQQMLKSFVNESRRFSASVASLAKILYGPRPSSSPVSRSAVVDLPLFGSRRNNRGIIIPATRQHRNRRKSNILSSPEIPWNIRDRARRTTPAIERHHPRAVRIVWQAPTTSSPDHTRERRIRRIRAFSARTRPAAAPRRLGRDNRQAVSSSRRLGRRAADRAPRKGPDSSSVSDGPQD